MRAVEQDDVRDSARLGIDQQERHALERSWATSRGRPGARSGNRRRRTCPRVLTIVAALRRSSGRYLPRRVRNASRSFNCAGRDLLLEALGHERLLGGGHLVDVFAEDDVPLALGVDQLDGGLGLRREQPADHAAVGGGDRVLDEVALDAPARVEDVDQQLVAGQGGRCRTGPGRPGRPRRRGGGTWRTAAGRPACRAAGSPPCLSCGASRSITFCRSGSGRPPPLAQQLLARAAIVAVGVGGQGLLLVERQLGEPDLALAPAHRPGPGSSRHGRARPGCTRERTRGPSVGKPFDHRLPDLGRLARRRRRRPGRRPARASVRGVIRSSSSSRDSSSGGTQLDELPRRVDAARFGERLILRGREQRRGDLGADAGRGPGRPRGRPAGPAARAAPAVSSIVSCLSASAVASSSLAGRSLGQPRAMPRRIASSTARFAAGERRQQARRPGRPGRPGPVLGHALGDRSTARAPAALLAGARPAP